MLNAVFYSASDYSAKHACSTLAGVEGKGNEFPVCLGSGGLLLG